MVTKVSGVVHYSQEEEVASLVTNKVLDSIKQVKAKVAIFRRHLLELSTLLQSMDKTVKLGWCLTQLTSQALGLPTRRTNAVVVEYHIYYLTNENVANLS